MQQLSPNVITYSVGEMPGPECNDSLKIYLTGSVDLGAAANGGVYNWQDKFISAFVKLVDKTTGILAYSKFNYTLISNYFVPQDPTPGIFNQEQVDKLNWELNMIDFADCVFLNFLKRSTATYPMFLMGYLCQYYQKIIVRCPEQSINYATVYALAQRLGFAFVPGRVGAVGEILALAFTSNPKFQDVTKNSLPE